MKKLNKNLPEEVFEEEDKYESEDDDKDIAQDYYEWVMIPGCNSDEMKTGVTFKGDTVEYLEAKQLIFKLFNNKGLKLSINDRNIRIVDNARKKPIKIEVKPPKGPAGKVNITIFDANKSGSATIMITKTKDAQLVHVKTLAFRVVKYLLDGIIDGEIKESELDSFKDDFLKPGMIDTEDDNLSCEVCEKTLKTKNGLKIHKTRAHKQEKRIRCDVCKLSFPKNEDLKKHNEKCISNNVKRNFFLKRGYESSTMASKSTSVPLKYTCNECEFRSKQESDLKRHKRDKHDVTTVSTSPKPKKTKLTRKEDEPMEIEASSDQEVDQGGLAMDIDESQDILIERSRRWDEKIRQKKKKEEEEEKNFKKIEKEKENQEQYKKEQKQKQLKKESKLVAKMKNVLVKNIHEKTLLKPFLKKVPQQVENLIGEDFLIYPVDGDGACGLRSVAAWLYQDPTLGPYLGRNINTNFVKNWNYWKNFFAFPFTREIGIGKQITCESEEQLLDFFLNSKDGAFMWRDNADFAAIANIYQVKIKIITVSHTGDENPIVTCVEPDPALANIAEFAPGQVSDITLFHTKNVHFDLIVPKDSKLAVDGGLDYQRRTNSSLKDSLIVPDDDCKGNQEENDEQTNILIKKMSEMEERLKSMEQRVKELEVEVKHMNNHKDNNKFECNSSNLESTSKNGAQDHMTNHVKSLEKCEYCCTSFWTKQLLDSHLSEQHCTDGICCEKCDSKFSDRNKLHEHMKSHNQYECKDCQEIFFTQKDLENHVEEHSQFKCKKCNTSFITNILLETHIGEQHKDRVYVCDKCDEVFINGNALEVHKKSVHIMKSNVEGKKGKEGSVENGNMKKHNTKLHEQQSAYRWEKCEQTFKGKVDLNKHIRTEHILKIAGKMKQYNCEDCSFQGVNRVDLRKHTKSVQHRPSITKEECYRCNKEFDSYSDLMYHRKSEHPSTVATCVFYQDDNCDFDEDKCWWRHGSKIEQKQSLQSNDCKVCGETFNYKGSFMMHMKSEHIEKVAGCKKYANNQCYRNDSSCWFVHIEDVVDDMEVDEVADNEEAIEKENNLSFCKAVKKPPPDQVGKLMEMIMKLSVKVQNLERKRDISQ